MTSEERDLCGALPPHHQIHLIIPLSGCSGQPHKGHQYFWRGTESPAPEPEPCLHHGVKEAVKARKPSLPLDKLPDPKKQRIKVSALFLLHLEAKKNSYLYVITTSVIEYGTMKCLEERQSFLRPGKNP